MFTRMIMIMMTIRFMITVPIIIMLFSYYSDDYSEGNDININGDKNQNDNQDDNFDYH